MFATVEKRSERMQGYAYNDINHKDIDLSQQPSDLRINRRQPPTTHVRQTRKQHTQSQKHEHNHVHLQPPATLNPIDGSIQKDKSDQVLEHIDHHQGFRGKVRMTFDHESNDNVRRENRAK
jgi:hypothetical protein